LGRTSLADRELDADRAGALHLLEQNQVARRVYHGERRGNGKLLRLLLGGVQHGPGAVEAERRNLDGLAAREAGREQHAERDLPRSDLMSSALAPDDNQR
jgi:hypothetical protein